MAFGIGLISAIIGGIIYRLRGEGTLPRPIWQALFCLPIGWIAWYNTDVMFAAIIYILSVIVCLKGHGRNMDLGNSHKKNADVEPEWYEFLIRPLFGVIDERTYDLIGITLSGVLLTLPLIFVAPQYALVGASKGLAYWIGWKFNPPLMKQTEWGEFLTGMFIWGLLCL